MVCASCCEMKILKEISILAAIIIFLSSCGGFNQGFGKQKFLKGNLKQTFGETELEEYEVRSDILSFEDTENGDSKLTNESLFSEDTQSNFEELSSKNDQSKHSDFEREEITQLIEKTAVVQNFSKDSSSEEKHYTDWDWLAPVFLILGFIIMISGFAFFIMAAYFQWWFIFIGLGALLVGFFVSALFVAIKGGGLAWTAPAIMVIIAGVSGGVSLAIWGVIELIIWIMG